MVSAIAQEIEPALNTKQAAKYLGLSPDSLAVFRSRGTGPLVHYSGSKPVYYLSELRQWQDRCAAERRERLLVRQKSDAEKTSS